jgi:hypothetical protein
MFRRNIASAYSPTLPLVADGNYKPTAYNSNNKPTVSTVGENPSAKDRLPDELRLPDEYFLIIHATE